jgi:uncharacterized protein (TIGR02646 family)
MIKIKKSNIAPVVPDRAGNCKMLLETNVNNISYNRDPLGYDNGTSKFEFDSGIYAHLNIKTALISSQFGKCAFCESNVISVAYGDVEHFRPKKGYKQILKDSLHYTGYYWLAYDWKNLLFSCAICNQRNKKNLFPLINPNKRALNHQNNIKTEKPYFIDPSIENPKFLIKFIGATATGIDKNKRGKKTIESLGLNRKGDKGISDLFELRHELFETVNIVFDLSRKVAGPQILQSEIDHAVALMKKHRRKQNKFSAMINDNFPA